MTERPKSIHTPKTARRKGRGRQIAITLAVILVGATFVVSYVAVSASTDHYSCPQLNAAQYAQLHNFYSSYPATNMTTIDTAYTKAIAAFWCQNPNSNFGEWSQPSVEAVQADSGVLVVHALGPGQAGASANLQPGAFLYLWVHEIRNQTGVLQAPPNQCKPSEVGGQCIAAAWLDAPGNPDWNPDPNYALILQKMGVAV